MLNHLRLKKKKKGADISCPLCQGGNIELIQESSEKGFWRKEKYLCCDCDCEWDWTFRRRFLRTLLKIRPPKWMRIE